MKCIWKIVKYIPKWDADLSYSKVLCEINRFLNVSSLSLASIFFLVFTLLVLISLDQIPLQDFPSNWWKKQSIDTPLRTYKTIVHTMVSLRDAEIMTIAHCIPGFTEQSELFHYIDKLLRVGIRYWLYSLVSAYRIIIARNLFTISFQHMKLGEKMDSALVNAAPDTQKENVVPILELPKILKKVSNQEETQQVCILGDT